jgi:hypothetical protein
MREPTAAQALFGHLPSAAREPVKQSDRTLAEAMYPRPSQRRLSPDELREAWRERMQELAGLRRRR